MKTKTISAKTILETWTKGDGPAAAAAKLVLMQLEDYEAEIARLNISISDSTSKLDEQEALIEKAIRDLAAGAIEVREARNEVLRADTEARRAGAYAQHMQDLLKRLRAWDHMDAAADGPYWRREIDAALARNPHSSWPVTKEET